jgi:ubiquinone/menaquinone biosynthesis C-methylase UbiE
MKNTLIKEQFNKGARNFDNWSVTQNEKIMRGIADFCDLTHSDNLLDMACGTGAFSIYAAAIVNSVTGVDISEGMIGVAQANAGKRNLENVSFYCRDVEDIELGDALFSVVVSKSAFHHMRNYQQVFRKMARYCQSGGRICIQDIMSYDDQTRDGFFEEIESLVDISHYQTHSKRDFYNLYKENGIKLLQLFESESKLDFYDYIGHVTQSAMNYRKTLELLREGLDDPAIAACFLEAEGRLLWRRKVCTIVGRKD